MTAKFTSTPMLTKLTNKLGICESAVCIQIESRIESGVKIRIRIEYSNRIFEWNLFNSNEY